MTPIFVWDLDDDPDGNVQHLAEHDVTPEEAEEVWSSPAAIDTESASSRLPLKFGHTNGGRYLGVVWTEVNEDPWMVRIVTAFDVPEPRGKQRKKKR